MPADDPSKQTRAQRREYLVIYVLCVVLLAMLGVLWLRQQGVFRTGAVVEQNPDKVVEKPIELNTARWWELTLIRGIGEVRAREIVALRERKKGFKSIDELSEVRGITAEILERIKKRVRLEPRTR